MAIDWKKYSKVVFIDSNIVLECLALEQLPWREVETTGTILLLVCPTVLQEVDSKKNHSRLGDHARRFNKTLRPLLTGRDTVVIRPSPAPQVEIGLADCRSIDWTTFPELDRDEPDARVAVQALCARGPNIDDRVVISQDVRPLYLARQIGLRTHQIGDNWLRPKEISESEKKADRLQRELDLLKSREPILEVSFEGHTAAIDTYRIKNLSDKERNDIEQTIVGLNPIPAQRQHQSFILALSDHDSTLVRRYERWKKQIIPDFMRKYEQKVEVNFGQVEVCFRLQNVGQMPAEGLLVQLSASGGWLNDRYVLVSPDGPPVPKPRYRDLSPPFQTNSWQPNQPGKHEFVVIEGPKRSTQIQISCQDFRLGYEHAYTFIAWVDPHSDGLLIEATVTASNLHGEVGESIKIIPNVKEVAVCEIVDLQKLEFSKSPPVIDILREAADREDYYAVEFDGIDWDK